MSRSARHGAPLQPAAPCTRRTAILSTDACACRRYCCCCCCCCCCCWCCCCCCVCLFCGCPPCHLPASHGQAHRCALRVEAPLHPPQRALRAGGADHEARRGGPAREATAFPLQPQAAALLPAEQGGLRGGEPAPRRPPRVRAGPSSGALVGPWTSPAAPLFQRPSHACSWSFAAGLVGIRSLPGQRSLCPPVLRPHGDVSGSRESLRRRRPRTTPPQQLPWQTQRWWGRCGGGTPWGAHQERCCRAYPSRWACKPARPAGAHATEQSPQPRKQQRRRQRRRQQRRTRPRAALPRPTTAMWACLQRPTSCGRARRPATISRSSNGRSYFCITARTPLLQPQDGFM